MAGGQNATALCALYVLTHANGASKLLLDVFGEVSGAHTRMAIGTENMPFNATTEVEAGFWIKV
ncbi:hypothetical protein EBB79_02650 [Parasedimentitalea marina]|uniref:Uncharacterized protein n=1 Tax=Parasedimentitalea marina TaxID=2483033 RepID=A0A3T0MYQ8_9RHOB|nr:hypothetical protein EBB79_02650 [Parasedimentitalea marina]